MTTPAGWYDDGSGAQRYWDGTTWTSHVVPGQPAVPTYATPPGVAAASYMPGPMGDPFASTPVASNALMAGGVPRKSRVGLFVGIGVGVFLLIAAMTISAVVIFLDQKKAGPQATFDDLIAAWRAKDCSAEYDLALASTTGMTEAEYCDGADYSWVDTSWKWEVDVTNVDQGDVTAVITTDETYNDLGTGEDVVEAWSYSFRRSEGEWYYVGSELLE